MRLLRFMAGMLGIGTAAFGAALLGIGTALTSIGTALVGASQLIALVSGALGLVLSPIALIVAGLAAVVFAFNGFGKTLDQVSSFLVARFDELADVFRDTFGAMAEAIQGGDIALAANILWAGLKVVWLEGTESLRAIWRDLSFGMVDVFYETVNGVKVLWNELTNFIAKNTLDIGATLEKVALELKGAIPALFASSEDFSEMEKNLKAEQAAIDTINNAAKASLDSQHDTKMSQLAEERKAAIAGVSEGKAANLKAASDALAKAKADFAELKGQVGVAALHGALKARQGPIPDTEGFGFAGKDSRSQFGGRGAELLFGGGQREDIPRKQLEEQRKTNRLLQKAKPLKIGNG